MERSTIYSWVNQLFLWPFSIAIWHHQRVNLHFPMVFLWFSYGFQPMPSCQVNQRDPPVPSMSRRQICMARSSRCLGSQRLQVSDGLGPENRHIFIGTTMRIHENPMRNLGYIFRETHIFGDLYHEWGFIQSQNDDLFNRYWHFTKHIM